MSLENVAPQEVGLHPDLALPRNTLSPWPADVTADLRTDHAGETGAVFIYRGVLTFARDPGVRAFAQRHRDTEQQHLALIEAVLPPRHRSRLLPLWRLAGWLTGALPALAGPRAVYATIAAVETFVDHHYAEQLVRLQNLDPTGHDRALQALHVLLDACRRDEVHHRDEAQAEAGPGRPGALLRAWAAVVGRGSAAAVKVCRWI